MSTGSDIVKILDNDTDDIIEVHDALDGVPAATLAHEWSLPEIQFLLEQGATNLRACTRYIYLNSP
jgi:hypothetical protein